MSPVEAPLNLRERLRQLHVIAGPKHFVRPMADWQWQSMVTASQLVAAVAPRRPWLHDVVPSGSGRVLPYTRSNCGRPTLSYQHLGPYLYQSETLANVASLGTTQVDRRLAGSSVADGP
jgi:hypothetical protein